MIVYLIIYLLFINFLLATYAGSNIGAGYTYIARQIFEDYQIVLQDEFLVLPCLYIPSI